MNRDIRLVLCGAMIVLSALYALLVSRNPDLATAVAAGYVAVILTLFFAVNLWKKP